MFLAEVVGTVVSPVQIPVLDGRVLLLLQPVDPQGRKNGRVRVGIDHAQAGVGDRVLVMDEGNSARQMLDAKDGAVKTVVVAVVDYVEREGRLDYDHREARSTP